MKIKNVLGEVILNVKENSLIGKDLSKEYLPYVDLSGMNLSCIDFTNADLNNAYLRDADLSYANMSGTILHNANLSNTLLINTNLYHADLTSANISGANMVGANIELTFLDKIIYNHRTTGFANCPEGDLIGWKIINGILIKLLIPKEAKRSRATTNKCRCEFAQVLEFIGTNEKSICYDYCGHITTYTIGNVVYPDSFDSYRWNSKSHGIHFFMDRIEAETYRHRR